MMLLQQGTQKKYIINSSKRMYFTLIKQTLLIILKNIHYVN